MYKKRYKIKLNKILAFDMLDGYDKLDIKITDKKDTEITLDIDYLLYRLIETEKMLKSYKKALAKENILLV